MKKETKKAEPKVESSQKNNYKKAKDFDYFGEEDSAQLQASALPVKDRKLRRVLLILFFGFSLIGPPWIGRQLAFQYGKQVLTTLHLPTIAFNLIGFIPIIGLVTSLLLAYFERKNYIFHTVAWLCLLLFISEFCFLKYNFFYSNYVVYLEQAQKANAVDVGIIVGCAGALLFLIYFIILLITTKPGTGIGKLADGKILIITFFVIELFILICATIFHFITLAL